MLKLAASTLQQRGSFPMRRWFLSLAATLGISGSATSLPSPAGLPSRQLSPASAPWSRCATSILDNFPISQNWRIFLPLVRNLSRFEYIAPASAHNYGPSLIFDILHADVVAGSRVPGQDLRFRELSCHLHRSDGAAGARQHPRASNCGCDAKNSPFSLYLLSTDFLSDLC